VERRETSVLRTGTGPGASGPARESAMAGKILRNFRIVSEIGEGGMGVVYLAEHVDLHKRFAIKSLSRALSGEPDFRRRFFDEAQKQALLDDPNIVQVTDFFEVSGEFFLVMEYVDGQDLSRLIKSKGKLAESEALPIVRDILKGLRFAHAKGLVHRDIKPSNVLVDKSGRARIMDFGIAIMAGGVEKSLTAAGVAIGSPWYMSPEHILRPREVERRTDIYALGIVLYEMLTGGVPFDAETDFGVKEQQVRAPAPDPRKRNSEISEGVAETILKAMAKDPAERFQDCGEFLKAVDDADRKPGVRRPPTVVIAALVATLVASAGISAYLYTRSPVPTPPAPATVRVEPPSESSGSSTPDPTPRLRHDTERKIVYNVIQSGSEKAWFACTQFDLLKRKEAGLRSARLIGDTNIEEGFKKQILDHKANIANALREYSGFLDQLAKADAAIAAQEFDKYSNALEAKNDFDQIQIARVMKRHYERQRGERGRVDEALMGADCAALRKGT
jgi:serine/threonine protein kinase